MKIGFTKPTAALIYILILTCNVLKAQTPVYLDPKAPIDQRVADLLGRMTIEEKIGQMMQIDNSAIKDNPNVIANYFLGSVLSGGDSKTGDNTTLAWADQYDKFQNIALGTRLKIPIIYGIDAVHGNNDLLGTTVFPHNIGLGCSRNPELVKLAARVTAEEVAATGVDWTFAPCIAVPQDERWGRTYEGFSENPELTQIMSRAAVTGFQGDTLAAQTSILACAKHFLADGGTLGGKDQGNTVADETAIRKIHLPGYLAAIDAGVGSVMVSYSSINGQKMHGSKYWITDVLKTELGFKGFVVSDYAGVDQINSNYTTAVQNAVNAGIDMIMIPSKYADTYNALLASVNNNKIPVSRIDDAVKRILLIKFKMGLFEKPLADRTLMPKVGSAEHREAARACVRESLVLLKKKDGILPIQADKPGLRIIVAGSHADDIGNQCGGWTVTWQGKSGQTTTGTTILAAMKKAAPSAQIEYSLNGDFNNTKADYSVVVIGEKPYAEGQGDRSDLSIAKDQIELIKKMKAYGNPVIVLLISGRPMIIEKILHFSDVIFAAWLPGTEGTGVADILFGSYKPKGLLSHSWPRSMNQIPVNFGDSSYSPLYKYGYGITSFDNSPAGSPPELYSTIINKTGKNIELTFNKAMANPSGANAQFSIIKNGAELKTGIKTALKPGDNTTLILTTDSVFSSKDSALIKYISGNIKSEDGGAVAPTEYVNVVNWTAFPFTMVPAVINANIYSDMFGVASEACSDEGGGLNLTSIDDGDWMEYNINVPTTEMYLLSFRIASLTAGGNISLTSGGRTLGARSLPGTGSWQNWTTTYQVAGLLAGEQTLKILATKGGFKLHWFAIESTNNVEKTNSTLPLTNLLEQNYPNPFNPSTEIQFSVKSGGIASLKLYNTLGQLVKTLFNEYKEAGNYKINVTLSGLPCGVYVYTLSANGFISSRKMVLIK